MAAKSWSIGAAQITIDDEVYDSANESWIEPKPTKQEAYKAFSEILNVEVDDSNIFIKISVTHLSPFLAKKWVDWLLEDINTEINYIIVCGIKWIGVYSLYVHYCLCR